MIFPYRTIEPKETTSPHQSIKEKKLNPNKIHILINYMIMLLLKKTKFFLAHSLIEEDTNHILPHS